MKYDTKLYMYDTKYDTKRFCRFLPVSSAAFGDDSQFLGLHKCAFIEPLIISAVPKVIFCRKSQYFLSQLVDSQQI